MGTFTVHTETAESGSRAAIESTAIPDATPRRYAPSDAFMTAVICVLGCAVAFALTLYRISATFFHGEILPADNDAFYHARRILDTVHDPNAFYQFDPRLRAPEGMLIPWPWGYDYVVAMIVRLAMHLGISTNPTLVLVYVPAFAVVASIFLVTVIARQAGLGTLTTAMLVLAVAMSPLTQALHGIGSVDHHYAEFIFILAFLASALAWFRRPTSTWAAICTGLVLGLAPAVHTLLFILQAPLLLSLTILWLRGHSLDSRATGALLASFCAATIAAVAPSLPLRLGHFEHYYLDWFHVYVAICTSLFVVLLVKLKPGPRSVALLAVVTVLAVLPLLPQLFHASGYLADKSGVLQDISEAKSLWRMGSEDPNKVLRMYSALILLVPLFAIASVVTAVRSRHPVTVLLCVYSAFALPLLLTQFRFYYYGFVPIFLLPLLCLEWLFRKRHERRAALPAAVAIVALLLAAYWPSAKSAMGSESMPGREPYFVLTKLAMPALSSACESDPGIVLAKNNEGHYIRYFTECSVIANNFLVSPQDIDAIYLMARLFQGTPADLLREPTPIKYVLVRARGAVAMRPDGKGFMLVSREDAQHVSDPLTDALLWSDPATVDPHFELVAEIQAPGQDYPYARIWKIERK